MTSIFTRRIKIVIVVFVCTVVGCVCLLYWLDTSRADFVKTVDVIYQTLQPGMSRDQVYGFLGNLGSYTVEQWPSRVCRAGDPVEHKREYVVLQTQWWVLARPAIEMCFDESDRLISYYLPGGE